ncbi:hypothetical protein H0Z60_14020, partial [Ectothiorhodospiraceae bacterium WFHF3C12]|nr:hypothetical protein [Ectothiorhodospiraceae bacterium WFHF3C12]
MQMGRQESVLDLVIPGLLGPVPESVAESPAAGERFPALERLLSRGTSRALSHTDSAGLLGSRINGPGEPLPAGPVGLLGAGGTPGDTYWFRVDPVHLRADRDRLLVFGPGALAVTEAEAAAIAEACNGLLAEDEMYLRACGDHWYLSVPGRPDVRMASIHQVSGHYMDAYLPAGPDARRWNALLSELQMLLHTLPLNQAREDGGQLTVNGLWPWGGGCVPASVDAGYDAVFADDDLGRGAARLTGIEAADTPLRVSELERRGGRLLVHDTRALAALSSGDAAAWLEVVAQVENDRCADALEGLRRGAFDRVQLLPGGGRQWTITRASLRRVWRRRRPFRHW